MILNLVLAKSNNVKVLVQLGGEPDLPVHGFKSLTSSSQMDLAARRSCQCLQKPIP
jgi:hypothetical protein